MRRSVKASIALYAAVRSNMKRRQNVLLDKTAPMRARELLTSAMGTGTLEGTLHGLSVSSTAAGDSI